MYKEHIAELMRCPLERVQVTVGLADALFLPADPRRLGFMVAAPLTNHYTIDTAAVAVIDVGYNLYPGSFPLKLLVAEMGLMVQQEWRSIGVVGAQTAIIYVVRRQDW